MLSASAGSAPNLGKAGATGPRRPRESNCTTRAPRGAAPELFQFGLATREGSSLVRKRVFRAHKEEEAPRGASSDSSTMTPKRYFGEMTTMRNGSSPSLPVATLLSSRRAT